MIRLVSYAGRSVYRIRQRLLGRSALASGAAQEVVEWNRPKLLAHGFARRCPSISLSEPGGGYYAWKPYIIEAELQALRDGDWLFYCDVGRVYPIKLIDRPVARLIRWAEERGQSCLPGVLIPWHGDMKKWTKRDAFVLTGCDEPRFHDAIPVQASFSLWKACEESRQLATDWMNWCSDRRLVSDDANTCGKDNFDGFVEHRFDQCLLSLLCIQRGIQALSIGERKQPYEEKNPAMVARAMGEETSTGVVLSIIRAVTQLYGGVERIPRIWTGWRYRRRLAGKAS